MFIFQCYTPFFFRRSSQVFRGSYRPDRLHRKPRGTYAAVQHQLGSQARCGAQWMLWISLEDIRWRGRKNIFSWKTSGTPWKTWGFFTIQHWCLKLQQRLLHRHCDFFLDRPRGPIWQYVAFGCFWAGRMAKNQNLAQEMVDDECVYPLVN